MTRPSRSVLHRSGQRRRRALALVIERDGPTCWRCRAWIDVTLSGLDPDGPTLGHRTAAAHGGSDDPSNLALEHRRCNMAAGARPAMPPAIIARPIVRD